MLVSKTVSVGTTAIDLLDGVDLEGQEYTIRITGNSAVRIGGADVTSTNGVPLTGELSTGPLQLTLQGGQRLYAIAPGTGFLVHFIAVSA